MEALILYFGKVIFTSGVLFLYYKLFLKDKTFHHYNRFYLIGAVVLSLLLPLLKISYFTLEVDSNIYLLMNGLQNLSSTNNSNNDFNYSKIGAVFIVLGAFFFLTKLIFGLVKIQALKKKFSKENLEGISFYQTDLAEAPFSFFKNLFWKNSILIDSDLGRQILKHEMVHIEQNHSWDKIFLEIITSLFWFNPFFYLIKKEINLIHEYLADKKSVKNSDTKAFAQMLLASHFSDKNLPATSPFLSSNLKKRLAMLKKSKTKFSYARRILALPLLFILSFAYLVNAKNKEIANTNFQIEKTVNELRSNQIQQNKDTIKNTSNSLALQNSIEDSEKKFNSPENQKKMKDAEKRALEAEKKFNSPEYQKKMKDAEKRALEVEKKFNSPEFQKKMKDAEQRALEAEKKFNSPEYQKKMKDAEQRALEAEKKFNSPEFQKKMKEAEQRALEAEKKFNSPEFQKKMRDAEQRALEVEKKFNSPAFKKRIEEAEKKAAEAEKLVNSPAFKKRIAEAEKKAEEAANAVAENKLNDHERPVIFIDDKPSSNEEMQKLDPNKIESVNVFKKGFNGKEKGEIHIKLKK